MTFNNIIEIVTIKAGFFAAEVKSTITLLLIS